MRLTSIRRRRRRRRRRRWRQRPEIFRRRWSVATPVGLHPSYVATDHRRFLTTNPGGTPLIIRGKLFRQPRPALTTEASSPTASLYNNRTQLHAAIEFACLDIIGKKLGVPVYQLFGGRVRDEIKFASYLFYRY